MQNLCDTIVAPVHKRDIDIQRGIDTLDELSDIEPEVRARMRPTSPHHAAPIVSNG